MNVSKFQQIKLLICSLRPEDYKLVDAAGEMEDDKENIVLRDMDIAGK